MPPLEIQRDDPLLDRAGLAAARSKPRWSPAGRDGTRTHPAPSKLRTSMESRIANRSPVIFRDARRNSKSLTSMESQIAIWYQSCFGKGKCRKGRYHRTLSPSRPAPYWAPGAIPPLAVVTRARPPSQAVAKHARNRPETARKARSINADECGLSRRFASPRGRPAIASLECNLGNSRTFVAKILAFPETCGRLTVEKE